MLASLPMYDLPEVREATDAFWAAIARAYGVEGGLTRGEDWTQPWRDPELLFSQTCGYPFTHEYKGVLTYVGTPHYRADGCEGPNYCSIVFARQAVPLDAMKGKVAAFNNRDSMSGMLALQLVSAPLAREGKFFRRAIETGGHFASLRAVQSGDADVCAIDCVTVAYARRYRPQALEGLTEIARSPLVPGLPYVTRVGNLLRLKEAIQTVLQDSLQQKLCNDLLLSGFTQLNASAYQVIPELEDRMRRSGGLILLS
jgi:ABC-type phosphate/phosphonate transport system substrate-binding protein